MSYFLKSTLLFAILVGMFLGNSAKAAITESITARCQDRYDDGIMTGISCDSGLDPATWRNYWDNCQNSAGSHWVGDTPEDEMYTNGYDYYIVVCYNDDGVQNPPQVDTPVGMRSWNPPPATSEVPSDITDALAEGTFVDGTISQGKTWAITEGSSGELYLNAYEGDKGEAWGLNQDLTLDCKTHVWSSGKPQDLMAITCQ